MLPRLSLKTADLNRGDTILITGPTTGVVEYFARRDQG